MKTITLQVIAKKITVVFFTLSLFTINSSFALSMPLNGTCSVIYGPAKTSGVIYSSLTAAATEKTVVINWKTAAETENDFFIVEKSSDMQNFKTIALVLDGFAAEGTGKSYGFKEASGSVKDGKAVYYRLKQIDKNGMVNYSPILKVELNKQISIS